MNSVKRNDRGPVSWKTAAPSVVVGGLGSVFGAFSKAADLHPINNEQLKVFLENKVGLSNVADQRERWFGGRAYNRFIGEDPAFIELSGMQLARTLKILGLDLPPNLEGHGKYRLSKPRVLEAIAILEIEMHNS